MKILAYKGTGLVSKLIRLQTRSEYSHVAIQLLDGTVVEAWAAGGVRHVASPLEAHKSKTEIDVFLLTEEFDSGAVLQFLNSQLGKKYDFRSIFRFLTRRSSPLDDRWFCSELVLAAFRMGGLELLARVPSSEVSPRDITISPLLRKANA